MDDLGAACNIRVREALAFSTLQLESQVVIRGGVSGGRSGFEAQEDQEGFWIGLVSPSEVAIKDGVHSTRVWQVDWTLVDHLQGVVQMDLGLSYIPELEEVGVGVD